MINIVLAMFVFLCMTSMLGIFLHVVNMRGIPKVVYDVYCYGKGCEGKLFSTWVTAVLVPKSWFFHFYVFATLYTSMIVIVIVWTMFLTENQLPMIISMYIRSLSAISQNTTVSPEISLLAATLFLLHVSRRLYESLYVNVFLDSKMNLGHYIVGYLHYWGCGTVLLSNSIGSIQNNHLDVQKRHEIHLQHIIGIFLFFIAYYQQYVAHVTLANLRKNPQNKQRYSLPKGGLFNYISCPNFLCEIIIYIAIYLVLGVSHYPWALITFWVSSNQIMSATIAQNWYKSKFEEFPTTRKAIIPFVY